MIDNNSIIKNYYNQITIGNKTHKKNIICDNIELIEKLKDDKILNPNLDNNEYIIKCENENKYMYEFTPIKYINTIIVFHLNINRVSRHWNFIIYCSVRRSSILSII